MLGALALMIGAISFAQDNKSEVIQDGFDLISEVVQDGYLNKAYQNQNGGMKEAYIRQVGYGNKASQTQKDGPSGSTKVGTATILQVGELNTARQSQNNFGNSWLNSTQRGEGNVSVQEQFSGHGNQGTVLQVGEYNFAKQGQAGTANIATATQRGRSNKAWQSQDGIKNTAVLLQLGNGNKSWQTQTGESRHPEPRQMSDVYQNGWGHVSRTNQNGMSNTTTVVQRN